MKIKGLNPIKVEGSTFDVGYGYSRFVKMKLNGKTYNPILVGKINSFGIKDFKERNEKNIFGKVEEKEDHLNFYARTSNPKINGFITGISTIILGEDIWGPYSGFELGQVKKYKKINLVTEWNFKIKKGHADFVYDIWLNKNKKGMCLQGDVEIMVWLDYNFDVPWKEIGDFKDFKVKYEKKTKDKHPNDLGHTFAFIPKRGSKKKFDYKELINWVSKYLQKDLRNYWIRSIYLGIEFANNSEVRVKLKKSVFDFKLI